MHQVPVVSGRPDLENEQGDGDGEDGVAERHNSNDLAVHGVTSPTAPPLSRSRHHEPRRWAAWPLGAIDSQIEHDIAVRLRAADQRTPHGWGFDWFGVVVEVAGNERRLAVVADAGAARPTDGYVARLGEFEQARVVVAPRNGEVAAGELDRRAASRLTGWRVRRPCRRR